MRQIVDFTCSPLHKLSGLLHRVISPLVGHRGTHIRNLYDLMDKVRDVVLDEDDILASFDVKSLFTSVPEELAVDVCRTALESDANLAERSPVDVPNLVRLFRFRLSNTTYFTFENKLYKQTRGMTIGGAISVTAANLNMNAI